MAVALPDVFFVGIGAYTFLFSNALFVKKIHTIHIWSCITDFFSVTYHV